jgi:hypothetical protein
MTIEVYVIKMFLLLFFVLSSQIMANAPDCSNCLPTTSTNQVGPLPSISEWPIEYTTIHKENYERNTNATFCKRPLEVMDTIVLHHSESPSTTTAVEINNFHLTRGTPADPWYMIAYAYAINAPYTGARIPALKVTEGRPLEIVGAHAGTNIFVPMDETQKKLWEEGKIICGKEGEVGRVDETMVKDGKIKANVTTIGLVVIGNYVPFSRTNPNGYSPRNPRVPTFSVLDSMARTSCQIQKKYPRVKYIKWHNFYNATSCPGLIRKSIPQIKSLARNYGCEFI